MWYIYSIEYQSATNKDILSFAATWIGQDIMLTEINQAQKDK
jgi:hypothetical protein